MKQVTLKGTPRTDLGKTATNQLRKSDMVPCVIYGGEDNVHFQAHINDFKKIVYTPDFRKVVIEVDGKSYECLTREIQFHPLTDKITHIDFYQLQKGKKIVVNIPITITGFARGVKAGGKLETKLKEVKVRTLVEHLTDEIVLDVTKLSIGKSLKVKDLPKGEWEVLTSPSIPVVSVVVPRAMKSQMAGGVEEDETAEDASAETPATEETAAE